MDRKVKQKNHHLDKPSHQRWLYHLSDMSFIKALMIIWGLCLLAIAAALFLVKVVIANFK